MIKDEPTTETHGTEIQVTQGQLKQEYSLQEFDSQNHALPSHELQTHELQNHGIQNHDIQHHASQTHNIQNHGVQNNDIQNHVLQDQYHPMNHYELGNNGTVSGNNQVNNSVDVNNDTVRPIIENGLATDGLPVSNQDLIFDNLSENLQNGDCEGNLDDDDYLDKSIKRPRTTLTNKQRQMFRSTFELTPKPCRKVSKITIYLFFF